MYTHSNHIPQPPHSAGLDYKGLRPRIDYAQVPSPIDAIEADRHAWENKTYMTLPGTHAPLCTSDFVAVDQGNSSPKFVRVSTWNMPSTSRLASDCHIPIAAIFQPFADLDPREEPTATKHHALPVSPDYFCNLDVNMMRLDHLQRPELNKGTVDFVVTASEEYWAQNPPPRINQPFFSIEPPPAAARPPVPMDYVFAFDVSNETVISGFLQSACDAVKKILYGEEDENGVLSPALFPASNRIAIITFDTTLHFYDLSSEVTQMLVVADLDEVFVPTKDTIFVNPLDNRSTVEALLDSIPTRFSEGVSTDCALGSAIRGGLASLAGRGGHLVVFQSALPTVGAGALPPTPPAESAMYDTDKEKALHAPRESTWISIAEECAEEGVGVSMFLAPGRYMDVGSVGVVSTLSGGELFWHPRYVPERDYSMFSFFHSGLQVKTHYGAFFLAAPTELTFGNISSDSAFTIELEHTRNLSARAYAFLQCAALYTSVAGQRRVRVINLAMNVVELAGSVFQYADMETVVAHFAKAAMMSMAQQRTLITREDLMEKCSALLLGYRKQCAAATRSTQLIIPEAFRALPAFTLALQKTKPLKARQVSSDVRNYHIHRILSMSARTLMFYLYPRLLALHDLDESVALPQLVENADGVKVEKMVAPSCMRDSYFFMQASGVYLIDNEETMIFWVGSSVSPQLLQDLFGVDDINSLTPQIFNLPVLPTTLSSQVHNILSLRFAQRGRPVKMLVARQNMDAAEIEFSDMLVEDQNNGAMSYIDYLAVIHRQITKVCFWDSRFALVDF
ncbi:hypothetical protein NLJ89_g2903 [Agrocybe chaxingu]|uniref:Uncharacterized protein n=1 Tax=Agrocybe chaxingu TaxID=84603 RepID=A0A9W8KAK7_9AGAR|nr:hypothetical protein NLJ89_g2903 [Agrocybe chaxingu]